MKQLNTQGDPLWNNSIPRVIRYETTQYLGWSVSAQRQDAIQQVQLCLGPSALRAEAETLCPVRGRAYVKTSLRGQQVSLSASDETY